VYGELEHYFSCPYCMEQVSMLIEVYSGNQSYIEDCEVCCKPIEIKFICKDGLIISFEADRAQ